MSIRDAPRGYVPPILKLSHRRLALLALWSMLAVAGCADNDDGRKLATATTAETTTTTNTTTTTTTTVPPPPAPPPPAPACDPNYMGCVPIAGDVDCAGGSGDGPAYTGPAQVIGSDIYDLDADGDGLACE